MHPAEGVLAQLPGVLDALSTCAARGQRLPGRYCLSYPHRAEPCSVGLPGVPRRHGWAPAGHVRRV